VTGVVGGVTLSKVDITAKNLGLAGNDIDIRVNYRGAPGAKPLPAGITAAIVPMANGATNPTLTDGLANLNDLPFEFIAMPYTDASSLAAMKAFLDDVAGRWSWQVQLFGHCLIAYRGTFGASTTFGLAQNDQHLTCLASTTARRPTGCGPRPWPPRWPISVRADQAQPIRGVVLRASWRRRWLALQPVPAQHPAVRRPLDLHRRGRVGDPVQADHDLPEERLWGGRQQLPGRRDPVQPGGRPARAAQGVVTSKYGRSKLADDTTFLHPRAPTW
jgi:phage tail sheath gpL-like